MKKCVSLILAVLMLGLILSLAACSSSSAGEEEGEGSFTAGYQGEVNVYNWGEYISPGDDGTVDVIAEFEKKYHIKVNYTNFETNEELYNVLTNSNSTYDVIIPSDYMVSRLREEGLLEKIDFSNVPNYKYISDRFRNMAYDPTNEYSVPYTWGFVAIGYNTDMIEEGSVTGFKDLWNPDYKDDGILMFNNSPADRPGSGELYPRGYRPRDRQAHRAEIRAQKVRDGPGVHRDGGQPERHLHLLCGRYRLDDGQQRGACLLSAGGGLERL